MKTVHHIKLLFAAMALLAVSNAHAERILPVGVFDFADSGDSTRDLGVKVSALVSAMLSTEPSLILVERADIEKVLGEQEFGLSGTIAPGSGAAIGHLTGAKVLVTGRAFQAGDELIITAKIMGTETGRVFGELVKGGRNASLSDLAESLAGKIAANISKNADALVAKELPAKDRIAAIRARLATDRRPAVRLSIPERHFGSPTFDPAAETEFGKILTECGFKLVDNKSTVEPEYELTGEAFSEFGLRRGNLVSCKARIEIKLRNLTTGVITANDRQMSVAVDLSEQIAAKTALENAARDLADRIVPKLAE